jgi:single-strand binding protein
MSINKVILLGYAGKDPEVKEVAGTKVANLSLATTEKGYTLQNGIQVPDRTEWHSLIFWKGLAEVVEKYVRKGSQIYIEGKIKTRQYEDRTGSKRYVTEIFVDKLELLGSRLAQQEASLQSKLYQPEQSREDLPF